MNMNKIIIDPSLDERLKDGYYFTKFFCSNCGSPNGNYDGGIDVMIKQGYLIPEESFKCPNCGCNTLKKNR